MLLGQTDVAVPVVPATVVGDTVIVAVEVGTFVQLFAPTKLVKLTTLLPATKLPAGIVIVPPLERFVKFTVLPFTDSEPE